MYLPIFIAILLGLMAPSSNNSNIRGSVHINTNEPPRYSTFKSDTTSTGADGGTGGENGHLPPPKPKP